MSDEVRSWKPSFNPWLIGIVVTIAAFMEILDTTIVNVALPYIAGTMSVSSDQATYALTSYLVANGIVITVSGWIADTVGRKRYFIVCIAMFTFTSFLCGISQSLAQLVIFRTLQGFFGGGLQPNQQAIIVDTFEPAKRGAAFGVTAIATVFGPVIGPTLGGYITDQSTWRWIFFINVPIGIIAVVLNAILVEDPPWEKAKQKRRARGFDYVGFAFISVGLGCLQVMIDRGEDDDWFGSRFIVIMALLAFLGLFGAVCWLLTARKPIINLDIFKDRNFALGCVLIAVTFFIIYGSSVIIPVFAESALGYNALLSGLVLSPSGIIVILLIPIVGQIMKRFDPRLIIFTGLTAMGIGCFYASGLVPDLDFGTLVLMRCAVAGPLAFLFVPISTITYATLPQRFRSDGAALYSMARNVFGAIGVSLSQAAVVERSQNNQAQLSKFMTPLHQGYNELNAASAATLRVLGRAPDALQQLAVSHTFQTYRLQAQVLAYSNVFLYAGLVAFLAAPLCLLVKKQTGPRASPTPAH
ncbi:EmrB/QacA family drug resistance transporter [Beijerinckiaceae bacterium RH AL1]|nr:DHA2 family efflux MFS transporter permease subunit [Beijerinckiaceae bacterium]VVB46425.1 EmrB/QacA family drug resistance transporter [Beijerinckiaceae bacterium RH CH11]VVB46510.1 EmrB/QacA family drug resistance transporter [Beijerinckiaceae bacterium RH AL8]VVC55368.1 EmrB/QacA family drug resistance transporter [Beijerinckiaceae bacterium RH AL1]